LEQQEQPVFAWMIPQGGEVSTALVDRSLFGGWHSGNLLPRSEASGGNILPQAHALNPLGIQLGPAGKVSSLLQDPEVQPEVQTELLQAVQARLAERFEVISDPAQQTAEVRTAGPAVAQYTAIGTHTEVNSALPRGGLPTVFVDVPVGHPAWDKAVGERIQWMLGKHIQEAEVKLNPPHLGPLEVRISLQQDQANVSFLASHAHTREALEAALPRLREMFVEANLSLINVNVGQRGGSGQHPPRSGLFAGHGRCEATVPGEPTALPGQSGVRCAGSGMVDDYA
jgi:flagellar hook-length control protein FliK